MRGECVKNRAGAGAYIESDAAAEKRTQRPIQSVGIGRFPARLREAIGSQGLRAFGKTSGLSEGALHSYLSGDTFPTLDRLDAIAQATGRAPTWFIADSEEADAASQAVRPETLTIAVQLAAEALQGKYLPPPKYAELVALIYELLEDGLPEAKILRFARAAGPGE